MIQLRAGRGDEAHASAIDGAPSYLGGSLDEVRRYERALGATEIASIYAVQDQ